MPHLRLDTDCALFLDFDGTLAPIQSDPDTVYLPQSGREILSAVDLHLGGALAIIRGRDVRDLAGRIPDAFWRVGGHGADVCPPGTPPPADLPGAPAHLVAEAESLCRRYEGARLEQKGRVLALHYRAIPDAETPLKEAVAALAEAQSGYSMQAGKMVLELRPDGMHKGVAVEQLMGTVPFAGRRPVMVGDDTTDEDAIAVCLELGGSAIRVGDGPSVAPFRLPDSAAVWNWLKETVA